MDDPKAGWNPKSSSELFLGLLPYLLVFVVVPVCLLLVCWCSKYFIRLCTKKFHHHHDGGASSSSSPAPPLTGGRFSLLRRLCPRRNGGANNGDRGRNRRRSPQLSTINADNHRIPSTIFTPFSSYRHYTPPPTLFTNYTNYNPILEGELDLFPISYGAPTGPVVASPTETPSDCEPRSLFGGPRSASSYASSLLHGDPPPVYPEDPPPSYDSLFSSAALRTNQDGDEKTNNNGGGTNRVTNGVLL